MYSDVEQCVDNYFLYIHFEDFRLILPFFPPACFVTSAFSIWRALAFQITEETFCRSRFYHSSCFYLHNVLQSCVASPSSSERSAHHVGFHLAVEAHFSLSVLAGGGAGGLVGGDGGRGGGVSSP